MLEENVDEKYYLSQKMIDYISAVGTKNFKLTDSKINLDISRPITTDQNKRAGTTNYLCDELPSNVDIKTVLLKNQAREISKETDCANTIMGRDYKGFRNQEMVGVVEINHDQVTAIAIKNNTKQGYLLAKEGDAINVCSRMHHQRGTVQKGISQTIVTQPTIATIVKDNRNLKEKLCNKMLQMGLVKEYDTIEHSYSNSGLNGSHLDRRIRTTDGKSAPTLTTRADNLGVVVKNTNPNKTMKITTKNKRIKSVVENNELDETSYLDIYNQKVINNEVGTLKAGMDHQQGNIIYNNLRIRKLTPKECWRLMGQPDENFDKASKVCSNSQLYKQAGNSIVVNVLEKIFKNLLIAQNR